MMPLGSASQVLGSALGMLQDFARTALDDVALFGSLQAGDFAGQVEELSHTIDYLQVVAAGLVERVRKQEVARGPGGEPADATGGAADCPNYGATAASKDGGLPADAASQLDPASSEFRNAAEFLRARLLIGLGEARRRLALADTLLPRTGLAGQAMASEREHLAEAVACGAVSSRAATIISVALDRIRHLCPAGTAAKIENDLTNTAQENDADFLHRVARRWTEAIDHDGAEPSEELLRQIQGAFVRKPRHGLQHLEIFATTDQFEHLLTVMNTATNPRVPGVPEGGPTISAGAGQVSNTDSVLALDAEAASASANHAAAGESGLDRRSRHQKLLDGLVGACKVALSTGTLPAAGGLRPQILVTIDYKTLLSDFKEQHPESTFGRSFGSGALAGTGREAKVKPGRGTGTFTFSGPVTPANIRKLACDADILPVVLGSEAQILDIGRSSRVFPPHIRKAITARDQGCAFPGCTIPAPWCEAHHIDYWSRGGTTSTANGTLLCSHHHHVIHKEEWRIDIRSGVPWFVPPPHLDPKREPRRNRYFRC